MLLAIPVIIILEISFFVYKNNWTALVQIASMPFGQYPHSGWRQWLPFFHLLYYGLVKIKGKQLLSWCLMTISGTSLSRFLLWLPQVGTRSPGLALTLSLLYAIRRPSHAIAWMPCRLSFMLGLFLGALLITDSVYTRPSGGSSGH